MGKERVRGKYVRRVRGAVRRAAQEEWFQKGTAKRVICLPICVLFGFGVSRRISMGAGWERGSVLLLLRRWQPTFFFVLTKGDGMCAENDNDS